MRNLLRRERAHLSTLDDGLGHCAVASIIGVGAAVAGGIASNSAASKAADASDRASQAAVDANAYQGDIAKSQYAEYQKTYQPLEEQMVADANGYDSQANLDKAAGAAQATVSSQIGMARDRLQRTPGLDPSSAAATAANADLALKGAALGASSANTARDNVTNMAYARKQDAVALGKGLVSNAASGLASASAGANAIAQQQGLAASSTAAGVGAAVSGIGGALSKVNWGTGSGGAGVGNISSNYSVPEVSRDSPIGTSSAVSDVMDF